MHSSPWHSNWNFMTHSYCTGKIIIIKCIDQPHTGEKAEAILCWSYRGDILCKTQETQYCMVTVTVIGNCETTPNFSSFEAKFKWTCFKFRENNLWMTDREKLVFQQPLSSSPKQKSNLLMHKTKTYNIQHTLSPLVY